MPRFLRSFRAHITLLSVLTSGAVLVAFGALTYNAVQRMSLRRIDETIIDVAQRHAGMPRRPEHWSRVAESLQVVLGDPRHEPFILLVKGRGNNVFYASENWPRELPADTFPDPDGAGMPLPPEAPMPPFAGDLRGPGGRMDRPFPPPGRGRGGPFEMGRQGRGDGPPSLPVEVRSIFTRFARGQEWRVGVLSNPDVTLVLGLNLDQYNSELRRLRTMLIILMPTALLLIAGGGWWISQRALRPVRALTQAAEAITAKGLDRRIPSGDESAEFDRLISVFNGMLDRLERSFTQAVRFSADSAHELKTPLTILQGKLEQALQESTPGSPEQQVLNGLLEEVQRLKTITRKLLLLSMADSGQLRLHTEPFNLSEAVEAICEDVEIMAGDLKVEKQVEPGLWTAADPDLLRQIIQNLTSNAMKYNVPGGTVRIRLTHERGILRLDIGNTGPGIPPEERERVFERFYRADKARNRRIDGAGLGLNLARELARAHHGDLVLHEAREGWVSFTLTLPVAPASVSSR
ncbi:MAG: ATP-binding protein [FCB group bacterium]|jgi:heavy metal sensor kinase|nr:ATP-binding protein [FCB group bacterium]